MEQQYQNVEAHWRERLRCRSVDEAESANGKFAGRSKPAFGIVATCGYNVLMKTVSIRDAKNRLTELARTMESGETVVVTRNGRPIIDLVLHKPHLGLRLEALAKFKKRSGIKQVVRSMPADFDEPLPEDILLKLLPPGK